MTGHIKKISGAEKTELEKKITLEEISNSLKNTRNNVASRTGGFSGAFYKVIWCYMKKVVLGAIHQIFEDKQLTVSLRLGMIAIIPKGSKDRRYITNWRPLTLLETLYKLLSSTLAQRLKLVLDNLLGVEKKA